MSSLRVALVGFDITPRFHPRCGAWGCNPSITEVDSPLLARCLAVQQDDRLFLWYSCDLVGESPSQTDARCEQLAAGLGLRREQVLWAGNQNHSSGSLPTAHFSGSIFDDLSERDPDFMQAEVDRLMQTSVDAGKEAMARLQPAKVCAGRGYCDSVSFNTRMPMPDGGFKFIRRHDEAVRTGQPIDPTIGMVRFDDAAGRPIGVIFNFAAHPATMISQKWISSDWVGPARQSIEDALDGAPSMFCQGFLSNINCCHLFGTPDQARQTGNRLGKAAVAALATLIPVRADPFKVAWKTVNLQCQPMPPREHFERELAQMEEYITALENDPTLTWCGPMNLPEQVRPELRAAVIKAKMAYPQEGLRMLEAGETLPSSMPFPVGAVRIGDVAACLTLGEPFVEIGLAIRARSPFVHTLICGEINGLFGNIGTDPEVDRGYGMDSYYEILDLDGFRLPPEKGSAGRIISAAVELLWQLKEKA